MHNGGARLAENKQLGKSGGLWAFRHDARLVISYLIRTSCATIQLGVYIEYLVCLCTDMYNTYANDAALYRLLLCTMYPYWKHCP